MWWWEKCGAAITLFGGMFLFPSSHVLKFIGLVHKHSTTTTMSGNNWWITYSCKFFPFSPNCGSSRRGSGVVHPLMLDYKFARLTIRRIVKVKITLELSAILARPPVISPILHRSKYFFPSPIRRSLWVQNSVESSLCCHSCLGEFPVCTLEKSIASREGCSMYRARNKGLYMVARNFCMLLLNCSAWPCLAVA